ncbi:MAG: sodium:solute symporter [Candidatus Melainabacteria bacterium]
MEMPDHFQPTLPLIFLAGYFLLVTVFSHFFAHRLTSLRDFFLAGRTLHSGLIAVAFVAAWFGASSTLGTIDKLHQQGLSGLWYIVIPSIISCLLITLWMARPIAAMATLSQPEAVEKQYGPLARILLSIIILCALTGFLAAQMVACGKMLHGLFGLDPVWAIILSTTVVVSYAMSGGFFAVAVTDTAQLSCIAVALVVLLVFCAGQAVQPGSALWFTLSHQPAGFWNLLSPGSTGTFIPPSDFLAQSAAMAFSFVCAWIIAPEMWQRMSATDHPQVAWRAGWIATGILAVLFAMVVFIGISSIGLVDTENDVLIALAYQLPAPWLTYLVLIGFVSAVTSTMDSSINVGSLTLTHDLYQRFLRPDAGEKELVWMGRVFTALMPLPAMAIAFGKSDIIAVLWLSADVFASAMFIPVMGLLFWPNPHRLSGLLAMLFGFGVVVVGGLVQYGGLAMPWPVAPYSTLVGIGLSAAGFLAGELYKNCSTRGRTTPC